MKKHLSGADLVIILVTVILFVVALFVKGFTKDLLIEAGVLLVSIKLILMNHKNSVTNKKMLKELDEIKKTLSGLKKEQ
ncbi:MAG: hypothetical protein COA50_02455 [Flavobacteriaceae bacterium]|nr:MAG: hypothetical protein COA50_02455 [Flavobacteriaceae bacterium]